MGACREKAAATRPVRISLFRSLRAGLFAKRFATTSDTIDFTIGADVAQAVKVDAVLATLPRVEQVSDFHCVTN